MNDQQVKYHAQIARTHIKVALAPTKIGFLTAEVRWVKAATVSSVRHKSTMTTIPEAAEQSVNMSGQAEHKNPPAQASHHKAGKTHIQNLRSQITYNRYIWIV